MKKMGALSMVCILWVMGCATPAPEGPSEGPEELLSDGEAVSPEQQRARQRCEEGEVSGCRELAMIDVLGLAGGFDFERGAALFRWACEVGQDGGSCYALGELHRLDVGDSQEDGAHYFRRACEEGEAAGCHDEAVEVLRREEVSEEDEIRAVQAFELACEDQIPAGCTNLAYMKASGRGTAREHGQAEALFLRGCDEPGGWSAHRLAPLSEIGESEVYSVTEYEPRRACEQLEVLAKGSFEERVISSMDAEKESLRRCYDQARDANEESVGRLVLEADVTADGAGSELEIVDDTLGLEEVRECAQAAMSRHLDDGSGAGTPRFRARWEISFVHPPLRAQNAMEEESSSQGCDAQLVREAVRENASKLQECGQRYTERAGSQAGALVLWWDFASDGEVAEVEMTSTINDGGLSQCLEGAVRTLSIPPFEGTCPVQVPLIFTGGEELHFSVMGVAN